MPAKAVCRKNDLDVFHCSLPQREQSSNDVFVNKRGVSRQGDNNTVHQLPGSPCPNHAAPITLGSQSVFANKKGVGRITDSITSCTQVAQGSSDVFAGD